MQTYTIYGLCDPTNASYYMDYWQNSPGISQTTRDMVVFSPYKRIRYIGETDNVYIRYPDHLRPAKEKNERKKDWTRTHEAKQTMIEFISLQQEQIFAKDEARWRETYWINYYHYLGANLFNLMKYYKGVPGYDRIEYAKSLSETLIKDFDLLVVKAVKALVDNDEYQYVRSFTEKPDNNMLCALARRKTIQGWDQLFMEPAKEIAKVCLEDGIDITETGMFNFFVGNISPSKPRYLYGYRNNVWATFNMIINDLRRKHDYYSAYKLKSKLKSLPHPIPEEMVIPLIEEYSYIKEWVNDEDTYEK